MKWVKVRGGFSPLGPADVKVGQLKMFSRFKPLTVTLLPPQVEYQCDGFLEKNKDTVNEEQINVLKASKVRSGREKLGSRMMKKSVDLNKKIKIKKSCLFKFKHCEASLHAPAGQHSLGQRLWLVV